MQLIKQIIIEELERVLATLSESEINNLQIANPKNEIIYDYEDGKAFAASTLESDIVNLQQYSLVQYLPHSNTEEAWSFEFETTYGVILIVDIKRKMFENRMYWTLRFGQLYRGEQLPKLIAELENIEGYDKFISVVNKSIGLKLDPTKY